MVTMWPTAGCGTFIALGAVFLAGYLLLHGVLDAIAKRCVRRLSKLRRALTVQNIDKIAILGGIVPVLVVILLIYNITGILFPDILIALMTFGVLLGLLAFFQKEPTTTVQPKMKMWPPISTKVPSARVNASGSTTATKPLPSATQDFYRDLLVKARHDMDLVDRLLAYERERAPHASFEDLCRSAIARWERDSR
jgi:hypothetical protein